jgi:pseudo-rSAM protein
VNESRRWLTVYPYVYIAQYADHVLFYNTLNGRHWESVGDGIIAGLTRRLESPNNLGVVGLSPEELKQPAIARFIKETRARFMTDILDSRWSSAKPVQLRTRLHDNYTLQVLREGQSAADNGLALLWQLTLCVNERCSKNCSFCASGYRQLQCCHRTPRSPRDLSPALLAEVFRTAEDADSLSTIHVSGGDLLAYPGYDQLVALANACSKPKDYIVHYGIAHEGWQRLAKIAPRASTITLVIDSPFRPQLLLELRGRLLKKHELVAQFVVQSSRELEAASSFLDKHKWDGSRIIPYFNGANFSFFAGKVFSKTGDIFEDRQDYHELKAKSVFNPLHFGHLYVRPNGAVHAN